VDDEVALLVDGGDGLRVSPYVEAMPGMPTVQAVNRKMKRLRLAYGLQKSVFAAVIRQILPSGPRLTIGERSKCFRAVSTRGSSGLGALGSGPRRRLRLANRRETDEYETEAFRRG
jgi:hypothetical protein